MKIKLHNPYGYRVCYSRNNNKRKLFDYSYTNTYSLAKFDKTYAERYYNKLDKITWYILPIKKREYYRIWRGCPF